MVFNPALPVGKNTFVHLENVYMSSQFEKSRE